MVSKSHGSWLQECYQRIIQNCFILTFLFSWTISPLAWQFGTVLLNLQFCLSSCLFSKESKRCVWVFKTENRIILMTLANHEGDKPVSKSRSESEAVTSKWRQAWENSRVGFGWFWRIPMQTEIMLILNWKLLYVHLYCKTTITLLTDWNNQRRHGLMLLWFDV